MAPPFTRLRDGQIAPAAHARRELGWGLPPAPSAADMPAPAVPESRRDLGAGPREPRRARVDFRSPCGVATVRPDYLAESPPRSILRISATQRRASSSPRP